jgi:L-ascorbate metabolism protein UlaG (beta-lactamase superfamily)
LTFRNEDPSGDRTFRDVLRWAATRQVKPWPRWIENPARYRPREARHGELLITFVNHSTFLIQSGPANVLTDPVWSKRASPVQWAGPARVHAPGIPFDQLPGIDVVLISHNHYDHMDLPTLRRLHARFTPQFVTTLGNKAYLEQRGLKNVTELGWWGSVVGRPGSRPLRFSFDRVDGAPAEVGAADLEARPIQITATPAQHFSARTPFDRNRTLWAGFACRLGEGRLFYTGDSGYNKHFATIGARLGPFDAALVPIGAYEPRWFMRPAHVNPDEAVRAHLDLRSRLSVAMHFGCFQLTDEGIEEPVRDLAVAREAHGVAPEAFRILQPGETLSL